MMVTLSRIIKFGWQGFLRNGLLSVSTISIMLLSAMMFGGLIIFNIVAKGAVQSIQGKIDISVYFKSNVAEDSILSIKRSIENLKEVSAVEYISRDQALAMFKDKHKTDDEITQTLGQLEENPLLASLNIKAKDAHEYGTIANYLESTELKNEVNKVTYAQNQIVIDRLVGFIDTIQKGGLLLTIFLAFLAVIVIFNTIRLAIFSNNEQIGIMRLVGASNAFIRGPYIIEGVMYGILAAVVSFGLMIPLINFLTPYVLRFIPEMNLQTYLSEHILKLFLYQFLFSVGLGIVSSIIAIRKYLHI